jgi:hypothetical protein
MGHDVRQRPLARPPSGGAAAGDLVSAKYSPLDPISVENISTLRVVWRCRSADSFLSRTMLGVAF